MTEKTKMEWVSCALCGYDDAKKILESRDRYVRVSEEKFSVVRCKNCGLVYTNPRPTEDALSAFYPIDYPPYSANYVVFRENRLYSLLKRFRKKNPRANGAQTNPEIDTTKKVVLDFGCGGGLFLQKLQKAHPRWELSGYDIGANTEVKKIEGNISIHLGSQESFFTKNPSATFDVIYLNNVLEHLPNPQQTLQNLHKILKPNGELHIEVPNISCFKFRVFRSFFSGLDLPRHLYHFSPQTLANLLRACGFVTDRIQTTGTTKSTLRSIYFALGIKSEKLDPLVYWLLQKITHALGKKYIDTEILRCTAKPAKIV